MESQPPSAGGGSGGRRGLGTGGRECLTGTEVSVGRREVPEAKAAAQQ